MIPGGQVEWDTTVTIEFDDGTEQELEVSIDASVSDYFPARLYGPPENCSEAEGGEVDITVTDENGKDITALVSPSDIENFEIEARQRIEDQHYDHMADDHYEQSVAEDYKAQW